MTEHEKSRQPLPHDVTGLRERVAELERERATLQESEALYRSLFDNAPLGLGIANRQGDLLAYNDAMLRPGGYTRADIERIRNVGKLYYVAEDRARALELAAAQGFLHRHPVRMRRKDGTPYEVLLDLVPVTVRGQPCYQAMVQDVTEQRRAEAALRASQERHRLVSKLASDYVYAVRFAEPPPAIEEGIDALLSYTGCAWEWVTEAFERVTGYTAPEVNPGGGWLRLIHDEDVLEYARIFAQRLTGHREVSEYRIVARSGDIRWLRDHCQPVWDAEHQRVTRWYGGVQDITERKRVEETLREANDTLHALFQASPLAIYTFDPEGLLRSWNAAAERTFGWTEVEIIGRPALMAPGPLAEHALELHARLMRGESFTGVEAQRVRKDGIPVEVSLSGAPLRDRGGAIAGCVLVALDVTERKRLEEQLRQAQKIEAIGRLAGGVAHDFNNLLTGITGYSDLLAEELPADGSSRELLAEIQKAADRAALLTGRLLAFTRKQVVAPHAIDVNAVLGDLGPLLRRLIGEDVELAFRLSPEPATIRADTSQLQQVIINLAVNARDAMPTGGRLLLQTERLDGDGTAEILLTVADTGEGMTEQVRAHLFEPFFTTKAVGKGTGLGLSTVYGIVRQLDGTIDVESVPGRGTTFRIRVPAEAQPPDPDPIAPAAESPRGSETILLAEDDPSVRALVLRVLRKHGYTVLEASDGDEAFQLASLHGDAIQLLLTDVIMPRVSGGELAQRWRARWPDGRILFMSGHADDAIVRHGVAVGAVAFLQKPFTTAQLARKVREVLDD